MKQLLQTIVLCVALTLLVPTHADGEVDTWELAETLRVTPDEALDLTFQPMPEYSETEYLIHGWKGDDLHYVVITDRQPGGENAKRYWKGLLEELKAGADDKKIDRVTEGTLTSEAGVEVTYKQVSWLSEGEENHQMIGLIIGKKDAYWVMSMPFSDDIAYMVDGVKSILESSFIVE